MQQRKSALSATLRPYHPGLASGNQQLLFPQSSSLSQNYPNPFASSTTVTFQLSRRQHANLINTDFIGNTAAVLADETLPQGTYSLPWNAGSMPPGIYFCRLRAGSDIMARKIVLLK